MLPPTPTHFHSSHPLPPISLYSHPLPPIHIHFHLLLSTPIHSHTFPSTRTHPLPLLTHSQSFSVIRSTFQHPPTPTHVQPFSPLLIISNPPSTTCSLSCPFPVHIQILSPDPTYQLPFKPIFSPCVLRLHINFNANLFFLVFSFVSETTYHFRLNNCLCIFSRNFLFTKNSHALWGIYEDMFINMRQCCGHWKIQKNYFLLQNDQIFTKGVEIFRKHVFQLPERLASAKVERVLWLQRNDRKVTLLLIYHISGF